MLDTILSNIPSLLLYLVVFVFSTAFLFCGLNCLTKKKKPLGISLVAIAVLIPPIIAGIRYGVGNDFFPYLSMHNNASVGKPLYFRSIEPFSAFLIWISGVLRCSFLMFFGFSLITNTCFFFAYKNIFSNDNKKIVLAYLITLCLHFSTSLNAMRSMAAVAILALALSLILQKRTTKRVISALVLVVVAALFHLSALIAIIFIPALWIVLKYGGRGCSRPIVVTWLIYVLASVLMPVLFFAVRSFVPLGDYGRYLDKVGQSFSVPLANLLLTVPLIVSGLFLYFNKKERDRSAMIILLCSSFYVPISIAVGWITYADGLSRTTFMFDPLIIALMASFATSTKKASAAWRAALVATAIIVSGMMFVRNMNWSGVLPYKTIFQRNGVSAAERDSDTVSREDENAIAVNKDKEEVSNASKD